MKNLIFYTLIFLFPFLSMAQISDFVPGSSQFHLFQPIYEELKPKDVQGSPFYEDKYKAGIIKEENGMQLKAFLRYNVLDEQVYVKVKPLDQDVYLLPRQSKFSYQLEDYTYTLEKMKTTNGDIIEGYFLNFYNGKLINFYAKPVAKIVVDRKERSVFVDKKPAALEIDLEYYLKFKDQDLINIKLKEKELKKYLSSSKSMRDYFKNHKIKDESDVVKLVIFYDSSEEKETVNETLN